MTALNPPFSTVYPRSSRRVAATGPIWATVQCIFTLGLWPLLVWSTRWATFVEGERRELLNLANAWRQRVVGRNAEELDAIVRRLRPRPMLMVICWLVVGFNAAVFGLLMMRSDPPHQLWDLTYGHGAQVASHLIQTHERVWQPRYYPPGFYAQSWRPSAQVFSIDVPVLREPEANLYHIWLASLLLGYCCHFYAVRSHTVAVRRLVKWTNKLASQNHFEPIEISATRLDLNPLWAIITLGFLANSAFWAIPMSLSGALQRRYTQKAGPAIRQALANQARLGFAQVSVDSDRFCTAARCGARVPAAAKFCPRCGASV